MVARHRRSCGVISVRTALSSRCARCVSSVTRTRAPRVARARNALLWPALADGRELRSTPMAERFDFEGHGRAIRLDTWHGQGVLKVAPTGAPWSVWPLERELAVPRVVRQPRRSARARRPRSHDAGPRPRSRWSDGEPDDAAQGRGSELESAVASMASRRRGGRGMFPPGTPRPTKLSYAGGGRRSRNSWEDWRPHPGWPTPQLPPDLAASATYR